MQRRQWDANTQAKVVIQGLQGTPVAEICHEPQISQSQYSQGRDQFLAQAAKAFEIHQHHQKEARLAREKTRLNTLVGELTLAWKNSDELLGSNGAALFWLHDAMTVFCTPSKR